MILIDKYKLDYRPKLGLMEVTLCQNIVKEILQ